MEPVLLMKKHVLDAAQKEADSILKESQKELSEHKKENKKKLAELKEKLEEETNREAEAFLLRELSALRMEAKKDVLLHREAEMNKLIEEVKKLTPLQKNKLFTDIVAKHGKSFPRAKVTLPKGVTLKKKVRGLKTIKGTTDDLVFEIKQGNSITESVETVFRSQQEDIKQKIKKYM